MVLEELNSGCMPLTRVREPLRVCIVHLSGRGDLCANEVIPVDDVAHLMI